MLNQKLLLCLLLITTSSCAITTEPWSRSSKAAAVAMTMGTIADMYSTSQLIHKGGYELNPLLGSHPSDTTLAVFGLCITGLWLGIAELMPDNYRTWFLATVGILSFAGAGRNLYLSH